MWKPIKDFENYCINELGEVINTKTNKLLVGDINNHGYYRICLCHNGKTKKFFRHRLVATHFIENPNNYIEVNHIDGDKSNNSVSNLEWISRKENEHHCRKEINTKEFKPFIVTFNDGSQKIYDYKIDLANELNVTSSCIKNWLHNKTYGFKNYEIKSIEYI